jgi:hypothetical protein
MSYLMFQNRGEVEMAGLTLLGASSKRDDPKSIGFFGTGNKIAIACLKRLGAEVVIFSGKKRVDVTTTKATLRGREFDVINIGGVATSITTEMGPAWVPWMAVREFYCNAIDEGEPVVLPASAPEGLEGVTRVYVSFEHVRGVFENWQKYFRVGDKPLDENQLGRVLPKVDERFRLYRKGILVFESSTQSSYDYDCFNASINEERLAVNPTENTWHVLNLASDEVKKEVLKEMKAWEAGCVPYYGQVSPSWARILDGRLVITKEDVAFHGDDVTRRRHVVLPDRWIGLLKTDTNVVTLDRAMEKWAKAKGEHDHRSPVRSLGTMGQELFKALDVLKGAGILIEPEEVIMVEKFAEKNERGSWDGQHIRVLSSLKGFDLMVTLVHEWVHKMSGAPDRTRDYEDYAINLIVKLILGRGKLGR